MLFILMFLKAGEGTDQVEESLHQFSITETLRERSPINVVRLLGFANKTGNSFGIALPQGRMCFIYGLATRDDPFQY